MTEYSNPRMHAEIDGWPMGHNLRGIAIFDIERKAGKGERGVRTTCREDKGADRRWRRRQDLHCRAVDDVPDHRHYDEQHAISSRELS